VNRQVAIQFFAVLAIIAGIGVSYFPPPTNSEAIWALVSGFLGYGARDLFGPHDPQGGGGDAPNISKQAGFARLPLLLILSVVSAVALSGCGVMNAYTGAALTTGEANYAGAKQNVMAVSDMKMMMWADAACALPLGALARNATGNPNAVNAALVACPIPNVGVVQTKDGQVQVQLSPASPTPPYTAPATDSKAVTK
jgi:hypothetical protein